MDLKKITATKNGNYLSKSVQLQLIHSCPSKKITVGFRINNQLITDYEHNTIAIEFVPKGHRSKQIKKLNKKSNR
jgi:hypothetical protein